MVVYFADVAGGGRESDGNSVWSLVGLEVVSLRLEDQGEMT